MLLKNLFSFYNKTKNNFIPNNQGNNGEPSWAHRIFDKSRELLFLVINGFIERQCLLKASALTFVSLISLVPLLAFVLSVSKGLGAEKALEQKINEYIFSLPGGNVVSAVADFKQRLLRQVKTTHFFNRRAQKKLLDMIESFDITVFLSTTTETDSAPDIQKNKEAAKKNTDLEPKQIQNYSPEQKKENVKTAVENYKAELSSIIQSVSFRGKDIKKELMNLIEQTTLSIPSNISMNAFMYKTQIMQFVNRTKFGYVGAIGLLLLLFIVIKTLGTIENSFNDIWRIKKARPLYRKFTEYTSMLIIIPILLLASTTITAVLTNETFITLLNKIWMGKIYLYILGRILPIGFLWVAFISVYIFLPNTKVEIVPGIIGGMAGGTLFYILQIFYFRSQVGLARYNVIYGAFAAIPFFLLWIQMSWIVVLFGAELSYVIQNIKTIRTKGLSAKISVAARELLGLIIMERITSQFLHGKGEKWTNERFSEDLHVPADTIREITEELAKNSLIVEIPYEKQVSYVPGKDIDSIYVFDVLNALRNSGENLTLACLRNNDKKIQKLIDETQGIIQDKMGITLKEIAQPS